MLLNGKRDQIHQRLKEYTTLPPLFRKRWETIVIRAENIDFLRAEILLEDLNEVTNQEYTHLTITDLILLLYYDFIHQIRHMENSIEVARNILDKKKYYFLNYHAAAKEHRSQQKKVWLEYRMRIRRNLLLRGEIFIQDLSMNYPWFEITIEQLISMLFMDFTNELRKGNTSKHIRRIIQQLDESN